jgi:hypothetical protein
MSEYGDPISPEQVEFAVERSLELRRSAPGCSLDDQVREAVARTRDNPVGEASEVSFPASDPRAWIWERPGHHMHKER